MLEQIILVVHVLTAISIVGLILLQQGKGADMGASFGSGSSQTVFGAQGGGNILSQGTAILAALFFVTSLGLAVYAKNQAAAAGQVGIPVPAIVEDKGGVASDSVGDVPDFGGGVTDADAAAEIPVVPDAPASDSIPE